MTPERLTILFNEYSHALRYFAMGILHREEMAEDVVSDSFIELVNAEELQEKQVKQFLFTSARNKCLNIIKHERRKSKSHEEIAAIFDWEDEQKTEALMTKAELIGLVIKEIDHFPKQQEKIFRMFYFEEIPYKEIASKLGISIDTCRVAISRSIHTLRCIFKDKMISI